MEEKDEVVELKSNPEQVVEATSSHNGNEAAEESIADQDYSKFSKKDLVDHLKALISEQDFKRAEETLKHIKTQFEEIQDREKSEALKKFIDEGGSPDDFEFKHDRLDTTFETYHKQLRDRKAEHFKSLDSQKAENLHKKNSLLEELRKLVDGEDNKHSFDKFKEIQKEWKVTGAVAAAHARTLWASYHVLVDRFYDNRSIYFELKELDRRKNLEAKLELCQRAEKLADIPSINEAVRELNELHEDYKHIGPVMRDLKEGLWERFKAASDAVYARRDATVAALHQELTKNLAAKESIVAEVSAFLSFQSEKIKEWNERTVAILGLQKKWESVGSIPHSKSKDINKRFWTSFKSFFNSKGQFFKKLDETRLQNLELKKELVKLAEAIKESKEWDRTANELKKLQLKWKDIGPVPEKFRDKIFLEFKTACDFFFEQRRVKLEETNKEQTENLEKKEAICKSLEDMVAEKSGTLDRLKELQRSFQSIGFVPLQAMASLKSRFTAATSKFMSSLDSVSQDEKDNALLEIQLENLKSDPDAGHKIHQREQMLKKRIAKAEHDLSVLKNNLEFFGRSKNAEKMKAEFADKINASAEEVAQLKNQLKLIRAASR